MIVSEFFRKCRHCFFCGRLDFFAWRYPTQRLIFRLCQMMLTQQLYRKNTIRTHRFQLTTEIDQLLLFFRGIIQSGHHRNTDHQMRLIFSGETEILPEYIQPGMHQTAKTANILKNIRRNASRCSRTPLMRFYRPFRRFFPRLSFPVQRQHS